MTAPEWSPPTPAQLAAADAMVDVIIELLRTDRGVHAETAIAGAARIGGTFLFRSFGYNLKDAQPGSPVFSDAANEHGPLLMRTLETQMRALGIETLELTRDGEVPDEHRPHLSVIETQTLLEAPLRRISNEHRLSSEQAAHACALAAARLVKMCAQVLEPRIGFTLAVYGLVEGSKTMPFNPIRVPI